MKILLNQDLIISFLTWQVFIIILPAIHRFGGPILELTARERAVLYLAVRRRGRQEITTRLNISAATVKTHRKNIIRKLGITGKVAFRRALRYLERDGKLPLLDYLPPN